MLSPVENCVGCTACIYVCKNKSILMGKDENGFYVALKQDTCIECGKCTEFCLKRDSIKRQLARKKKPDTYVAWAKEETVHCIGNSGGLFSAISHAWIKKGGVVAAPVYDQQFVPRYITATNPSEISLQAWSKFVQSELGNIFPEIKKLLENGTEVLFVGAPCQVKGLYSYLGGDHEKLVTVQFPCIGMPPQWFYQEYLKDITGCSLSDISKVYGEIIDSSKHKRVMKIILKDDRCFSELAQDSVFVKAWNSFRILKDSCCQCNDNISPVCADFTWGNFWYLGTIDKFEVPQEEYTDGSSMLLVHSMKAEGLLNQWRSTISIHPRTYKEACIGHLMFQSQLNRHIIYKRYIYSKSREYFQKKWRTESYQQLKKEFFSISNNQSFELAAKLDIKFKAYIWYIIYNIQRMINKLYEIFKKQ